MTQYNFQYKFRISNKNANIMIREYKKINKKVHNVSDILEEFKSSLGDYTLSVCNKNIDLMVDGKFQGNLDIATFKYISKYSRPFVVVDKTNGMYMKKDEETFSINFQKNLPEEYCEIGGFYVKNNRSNKDLEEDLKYAKDLYGIGNIKSIIKKIRSRDSFPELKEIAKNITNKEAYIPILKNNETVIQGTEDLLLYIINEKISKWSDKDIDEKIQRVKNSWSTYEEDKTQDDILYDYINNVVYEYRSDFVNILLGDLDSKYSCEQLECFYCSECTDGLRSNVCCSLIKLLNNL